jgi:glycolate oxidase
MSSDLLAQLRAGLPASAVVTDPAVLESYRHDRAMFCPAGAPAVLARPADTAQVQHAVRTAGRFGVPVVPQGARTGLSGAANAIDGCLLLSTEKLNRVLEVDAANRLVVTQPGVLNADLTAAVAGSGMYYPPDPSSRQICSIGGNLATNAGGLCCVKYGVTADYVLALEVVLASGEVLRTGRRTVKGVAGYDLTRLFVGSEGTLGVITEATLRLRPVGQRPRTMAALFPSTRSAGELVCAVVAAGLTPSLLEIMDAVTVRAANAYLNCDLPQDAAAMVVAQSDAGGEAGRAEIAELAELARRCGAGEVIEAEDEAEGELLLAARRAAGPALDRLGTTLVDDVCVPRDRLGDLIDGVAAIAEAHRLVIGMVGHAGDGNMHPNVVFDQDDASSVRQARQAFGEVMDLALSMGGTITGEHGVGVLKREWLDRELGPVSLGVHRALKQALDPAGLFNPGKVFTA